MAQNPMQRKMTNSFLLGMFITLLLAALVVGFLLYRMNGLTSKNKELQEEKDSLFKTVYVATETIGEGTIAYGAGDENGSPQTKLEKQLVATNMNEGLLEDSDLETYNPDTQELKVNVLQAKVEIPKGTIVTKSMLINGAIDSTERLVEYNMISLPSQLTEGVYIDVRLKLPSGQDYVVVAKKYVEQANATTIWLKMSEIEIESLSNAIIESYIIDGSSLWADVYTSPQSQKASKITYVPTEGVQSIIKYMIENQGYAWANNKSVRSIIEGYLGGYEQEEIREKTNEGVTSQEQQQTDERNAFLGEGTY